MKECELTEILTAVAVVLPYTRNFKIQRRDGNENVV